MKPIVAGYTAAPPDRAGSLEYYRRLMQIEGVQVLQFGSDEGDIAPVCDEVLSFLPRACAITLNYYITRTYGACLRDKRFGLASPEETG
jgi:hypothetical protein